MIENNKFDDIICASVWWTLDLMVYQHFTCLESNQCLSFLVELDIHTRTQNHWARSSELEIVYALLTDAIYCRWLIASVLRDLQVDNSIFFKTQLNFPFRWKFTLEKSGLNEMICFLNFIWWHFFPVRWLFFLSGMAVDIFHAWIPKWTRDFSYVIFHLD